MVDANCHWVFLMERRALMDGIADTEVAVGAKYIMGDCVTINWLLYDEYIVKN
jgi:hypothetical protein